MNMITIEGEIGEKAERKLKKIPRLVVNGIVQGVNREATNLHRHVVKRHLSGAGSDAAVNRSEQRLRRRTGDFVRKTKRVPAAKRGADIVGGVDFESPYANVHVGEKGKVTTIRPVNRQWLAVPLPPAMTRAGVSRGNPRDFPGLFFMWPNKSKPPMLVKTQGSGKGARIVPYFLLVKMVKIRARIFPKEIIRERKNMIMAGIRNAIIESVRKGVTN